MGDRAAGRHLAAVWMVIVGVLGLAGPARGQVSYAPGQIRTAYGVNALASGYTGSGVTVAIVDADDDASAVSDANAFSTTYGLSQFNVTGGPTLSIVSQTGGSTLPTTAATGSALSETSIDIQWVHAIAPKANILLVEANSFSSADLTPAINTARTTAGVSSLSMSFGSGEYSYENLPTSYSNVFTDGTFTQTAGHTGVAFLAATGDSGTVSYPAASPNVIAVGGTALTLDGSNQRTSETVWNDNVSHPGTPNTGSTGSGTSAYETKPTYQAGVLPTVANRIVPDVALDADPFTGYNVEVNGALTYNNGGTSVSCPVMTGLIALADQQRVADGLDTLTSTQALQALYNLYGTSLYSQAFYDVTSGSANGYSATTGYDEVSGLGVPNAAFLVAYLAGVPEPTSLLLLTVAVLPGLGRGRRRPAAAAD